MTTNFNMIFLLVVPMAMLWPLAFKIVMPRVFTRHYLENFEAQASYTMWQDRYKRARIALLLLPIWGLLLWKNWSLEALPLIGALYVAVGSVGWLFSLPHKIRGLAKPTYLDTVRNRLIRATCQLTVILGCVFFVFRFILS